MVEGIKRATVEDALGARAWQSAADLAERALAAEPESMLDSAFFNYVRGRSLSNLDQYTAALDPAQRAVTLAEQAKAYDLLGLSLIELAWIERKIEALQAQSVRTIDRYFVLYPQFTHEAASRYLLAMFSRGACLRSAGHHREALDQFRLTYEEATKRRESDWANRARSDAVYEAFILRELDVAEALISQGADYITHHHDNDEAVANHLLDQGQLAFLRGDYAAAKGKAQEAAVRAANIPLSATQAYDLLHKIAQAERQNGAALATAVLAKIHAQADDRPEMVASLGDSILAIALADPEAAEQFIRDLKRR